MSHRIATTARASSARLASAAIGRRAAPSALSASQGDGTPSASSQLRRGYSSDFSRPTFISLQWPSRLASSSAYAAPSSRRSLLTSRASTRGISSTPHLRDDAAEPKPAEEAAKPEEASPVEDGDDPCPPWQNPLHHNNPDYTGKVLAEDFAPGEEMPSVPLPPFETEGEEGKVLAPPHIHELAEEIVKLNMLEVKELVDRIGDHFGFDDEDGYVDEDGGGGGGGEEEAAVEEEKTAFELKLMGYDAKGKIKVIKEVRGMAGLGLKEAKELVEGAPTVIKKDVKKEEAEELKAKLEAVGAQVEIV